MEKWTGSKLGKEYVKAVHCHSTHLTYMQSTSCEMLGWMKHKLENFLRDWNTRPPYHLLRMYAGQETTVRTRHGTMDWFQIGKGVCQGCRLSPCLFNLYAEYIMRNAGLDEAQLESVARRNINNLRYADDTTVMTESEEELKSLLMKVRE